MAHHASALKRARQNEKRNARNRHLRSTLRTHLKKYRTLLQGKDAEAAGNGYSEIQQQLDKAVTKGILHRNAAARSKSRLAAALKKLGAA
jgi:small subunit ribosomal protein S20